MCEPGIAIIGTRNMTTYGETIAKKFAKEISLRNIPVISGMAIGIDSVAHSETLKTGGKTIAVIGSGLDNIYPKENISLFNQIIENGGLVITEYSDNIKGISKNFPERNRIVSGLSKAVLVIEAAYRSGTSITARFAKMQGKRIYAIPGRLDSKYGVGTNYLIKNGAKIITNINDILEDFEEWKIRKKRVITHNQNIKKEYRKIYSVIGEEPLSIEEISLKTDNDIMCTSRLLTLMEIEDLVDIKCGGYIRKEIEV